MYKEIEDLLIASKKGDEKAKETLLMKLNPLIISSIRRYYNKKDIYEDLIQDGYEVILKSIKDYDTDKGVHFLGYVKSMLKYCYLNKHKEKKLLSLNEPIDDELELMDLIIGDEEGPLKQIVEQDESSVLYNSLNCLTKRQKRIIADFYINGKAINEIAEELGISYRTVVNIKVSAMKKLKEIIVK